MKKSLMFKAPPGEGDVHLALTSGHTAIVTEEGSLLEPHFHREAIAKGCYPEGIPGVALEAARDPTRKEMISNALKEMIAGNDPQDFTTNGRPNKANLDTKLGFVTERHEVDTAFAEVLAQDDGDGDGDGQADDTVQDDQKDPPAHAPSATTHHAARTAAKGGKGHKGGKK